MKRQTARALHRAVNMSFWMENPNWSSGNRAFDWFNSSVRLLPFSIHEFEKKAFFDISRLIAVNAETVVVSNGPDKVDKFMLRYPGKMALEAFCLSVGFEIGVLSSSLGSVAVSTEVGIKNAKIFRNPRSSVPSVVQTQPRLDLSIHRSLTPEDIFDEPVSPNHDRTMKDIEQLLRGAGHLAAEYDFIQI